MLFGLPFGTEIDLWSLGCILAELYSGLPLFPGTSKVPVIKEVTLRALLALDESVDRHHFLDESVDRHHFLDESVDRHHFLDESVGRHHFLDESVDRHHFLCHRAERCLQL